MSQISKCPEVMVVLTYWEASGEVQSLDIRVYFISVPNDHTVAVSYSEARMISVRLPSDVSSVRRSTEDHH